MGGASGSIGTGRSHVHLCRAFDDHAGFRLLVLERLARRHGRSLVLRTGRRWAELLVATLELTRVRVERVA